MTLFFYFCLFLFLFLSLLLCFVILIQEAKSLGLGASFGGNTSDSLFGTATAEVLKRFTAYVSGIFLVSCLFLSFWTVVLGKAERNLSLPMEMEQPQSEVGHEER